MSNDTRHELQAKVLTVSDGVCAGTRSDTSGVAVVQMLMDAGFEVRDHHPVPDGIESVSEALVAACAGFTGLVVTTGGTGFGPRDLTPEATATVIDRQAPGLAEAMRSASPLGRLSRGIAGTRGESLILNVPGSTTGATESLAAVMDVLAHALGLLSGENPAHPGHDARS